MFRKHLNAATVISIVALVFAMTGGAYAAKKFLITSTKQISPSVLKALAGKTGSAGAQGPAGPVGAVGAKGETGAGGKEGAQGKEGPAGKEGPTGPKGTAGSTGPTGPKGATGEPWTAGGTLPSKKTETGFWAATDYNLPEEKEIEIPLSFPIPLKEASENSWFLTKAQTEKAEGPGHEAGCTGTAAEPVAPPGFLCVYTYEEVNSNIEFILQKTSAFGSNGYSSIGAAIHLVTGEGTGIGVKMQGSFAVTAP